MSLLLGPGPECRVCGCTEHDACEGGCVWAEPDLCSQCVGVEEGDYDGGDLDFEDDDQDVEF